jgi:ABC-type glycerol-3-phosphate transport system substrate-binding protein
MNLNRRQWMIGSAAGLAAMGIARPSWAQDAAQSATGVPYVKKDQINGGKPIKLTYWEWVNTRAEYEKRWAAEYNAMYPNVEIEIVMQPSSSTSRRSRPTSRRDSLNSSICTPAGPRSSAIRA